MDWLEKKKRKIEGTFGVEPRPSLMLGFGGPCSNDFAPLEYLGTEIGTQKVRWTTV